MKLKTIIKKIIPRYKSRIIYFHLNKTGGMFLRKNFSNIVNKNLDNYYKNFKFNNLNFLFTAHHANLINTLRHNDIFFTTFRHPFNKFVSAITNIFQDENDSLFNLKFINDEEFIESFFDCKNKKHKLSHELYFSHFHTSSNPSQNFISLDFLKSKSHQFLIALETEKLNNILKTFFDEIFSNSEIVSKSKLEKYIIKDDQKKYFNNWSSQKIQEVSKIYFKEELSYYEFFLKNSEYNSKFYSILNNFKEQNSIK
tara:strand:+ start:29 stop:793 length:765 start_codon:yes stop_codon:yes gene_type:complete